MTPENATMGDAEATAEPCCAAPGKVDEDAILADVRLLAAAGNDTRYELLRRIAGAAEEVCVCELEPAVGVSQSAVSQALSRLAEAGLVTRRKEGSWRYYDTTSTAESLLATLDDCRDDEVGSDV